MKRTIPVVALLAFALTVRSQGTFLYDQQSYPFPIQPDVLLDIQPSVPMGQSFIPSLSSVGFVQLELFDGHPNNGLSATLYVSLRSGSITGAVLSSSSPVFMPETPSGGGVTNFFFSPQIAVTPGTTYFFEVVVQSGDLWRVNATTDVYPRGTSYLQGNAQPVFDLWFRRHHRSRAFDHGPPHLSGSFVLCSVEK